MSNTPAPSRSEPLCALLVMCVECGQGLELRLPLDRHTFSLGLAHSGWFPSVLTPPGQGPEVPMLLAALCAACAQKVLPPEVLAKSEQSRQQLLQAAQLPPGKQGAR